MKNLLLVGTIITASILGLVTAFSSGSHALFPADQSDTTARHSRTTLAFVGDHGAGADSFKVFELIKREGADLLVSQGDFGYDKTADEFESVLSATLGSDFPIVAILGNHDWPEQVRYQTLFTERLERTPGLICQGDTAIRSTCSFRGINVVSATPGIPTTSWFDSDARYFTAALASSRARWTICNWHKNQTALQLGKKGNDVGWGPYEACRKHGALIVNGHEHSYSRTSPITRMANEPEFVNTEPTSALIHPGQTIVIVSGLGGKSVRSQQRDSAWFAAAYTSDQNAKAGALFCTFEEGGASQEAQCRFVNIDGEVVDRFHLTVSAKNSA